MIAKIKWFFEQYIIVTEDINDDDVEHQLPALATYLGHTHVADTYWYLSAVPELLNLAALRVEQAEGGYKS